MLPVTVYWLTLEIFFLVAYVLVLSQVLLDVLRDRHLGGLAQALWVFFLLLVPLGGLLAYLVARGPRMAHRRKATVLDIKVATPEYVRAVAGTDAAQQISIARDLRDDGTINAEEFLRLKTAALATTA
ncbi:PLDc N-terminal domain-containing protein [Promicromonospora kroppenstedtii]|uniref:PLDc N-terminal domain-containing protein n=1 Tax=Promicromonospora kroppenstedtii TaxID=440482 RepID=UPI0004BB3C0F|nr:PLDc N-terminal domain-containing protein [Promicromonospora kroppenstedtii]